jgi:hypothetical protein
VSIRQEVQAALSAALDPDVYQVEASLRTPERIGTGKRPVRVWTASIARDFTLGHVTVAMVVWVLTGKTDETTALEDDLDAGLDDVLGALHTSNPKWAWTTVQRATMDTPDGTPVWHGYRIDVTSVGKLSKG